MTTNLTIRSAQADTITAVPPRSVPRGTHTAWFTRLLLLALLASFTIPLAHAQVTYTYTGKDFTAISGTLWTISDRITATLTTPVPFPPIPLFSVCPVGTTITITVGDVTLQSPGQTILDNCALEVDSQGKIEFWNLEIENATYVFQTVGFIVERSDSAFTQDSVSSADNSQAPGSWAPPTAQNITTALLGHLTGDLNIPGLGTSLVDQVTLVLSDLNQGSNGLACLDLQNFASHVKAQRGKKIPSAQATTILQWVGWIAAAIPGGCQIN